MKRPQVLIWNGGMTSNTPAMIIMIPTTIDGRHRRHDDAAKRDQAGDEIDDAEGDDPAPFGPERREACAVAQALMPICVGHGVRP